MADTDSTKRLKRDAQGLTLRPSQQLAAGLAHATSGEYEPSRTLLKAAVAAVVVGSAFSAWTVIGSSNAAESGSYGPDRVSTDETDRRFNAYIHATPLVATEVSQEERLRAIAGMGLPAEQQQQLAMDLSDRTLHVQSQAAPSIANNEPVRLVWLTFWDTDNEDGDAVRVDSGVGYTRTVNLTKQPLIMAIPVARGVPIKLKGIRDGEGGGITVGVASGSVQAALPIMSTGQVLALKVVVP